MWKDLNVVMLESCIVGNCIIIPSPRERLRVGERSSGMGREGGNTLPDSARCGLPVGMAPLFGGKISRCLMFSLYLQKNSKTPDL